MLSTSREGLFHECLETERQSQCSRCRRLALPELKMQADLGPSGKVQKRFGRGFW